MTPNEREGSAARRRERPSTRLMSGLGRIIGRRLSPALLAAVAAVVAVSASASAQEEAAPVKVALSLSDGKKVFRAGEAVRLVMSFTSDQAGYQLNVTTTKPATTVDSVLLAPADDVYAWAAHYIGGAGYHPDHSTTRLLSAKPTTVGLTLPDWYRFDRPGKYSVKVMTFRVSGVGAMGVEGTTLHLMTNEVSFQVVGMGDEEEAREVARLSALLDAAKDSQEEARLAEELSYLTGEPSTREKVRRYLAGGRAGNYAQDIHFGLMLARDRALAVRLLEAAIRDPEVKATHALLHTAVGLRLMLEGVARPPLRPMPAPPGDEHPRTVELLGEYVAELVGSLPKRKGESRRAAAMTALTSSPRGADGVADVPPAARAVLVAEFDSFQLHEQEHLLSAYWDALRDPALLPAVERVLTNNGGQRNFGVRTVALRRLAELSAERARACVIAEMRDPTSLVDYELLAALADETLPEADDALLEQIRSLAPSRRNSDEVLLRHKAMLAARYASPAVYDGLLETYHAWGDKWQPDTRGALLGYLARHNASLAVPLAEQALAQLLGGHDSSLLLELTRSSYPGPVRELLRRRLEADDPGTVGRAASVMSRRGAEGDAQLIESRLERWRKEQAGRVFEPNARGAALLQQLVEIDLIESLLGSAVWKLPEDRAERILRGCVSEVCRRRYIQK